MADTVLFDGNVLALGTSPDAWLETRLAATGGIELASTMGDEIQNPKEDLGPAIKLVIGVVGPTALGCFLFWRTRRMARQQEAG
jgi:hypothetical protein